MDKKQRILVAAQELFGIHGFAKTTVKMISQKADVAFGLVAHYFGSKDQLFIHAGSQMADSLLEAVSLESGNAATGLQAVRSYIRRYLEFTLENAETFSILLRCSPFSDVRLHMDRQPITDAFTRLIEELQRHLERGMDDGSIRRLPPRETAFVIYSSIVGAVRTRFIAPYDVPGLYGETLRFVIRSIEHPRSVSSEMPRDL